MNKQIFILCLGTFVFFALSTYWLFCFPYSDDLWRDCGLKGKIEKKIFQRALNGKRETCRYSKTIVIIDFSKPSTQKRFFVIDLRKKKLLFETYVAHGQGSGENYATDFSNQNESHKSSLGFYQTLQTYYGKHGYSLRLKGLEKDINDNAEMRSIVIHGAEYVSDEFIKKNGRLGRSHGCPALPLENSQKIIDETKNGVCLYIHADDSAYYARTRL